MITKYGLQPKGADLGSRHLTPGTSLELAKIEAGWWADDLKLDVEVFDLDTYEAIAIAYPRERGTR